MSLFKNKFIQSNKNELNIGYVTKNYQNLHLQYI